MVSGTGDCIVQFDQVGDATFAAASQITGTVTANKLNQSFTLSALNQFYDGKTKPVTATTTPAGLLVLFTYTGTDGTSYPTSSTPPIEFGRYLVDASISDTNYSGTASGTLVIMYGVFLPLVNH
jgi:hypothetical protein